MSWRSAPLSVDFEATGDATELPWNSHLLTVACSCGVVFERWVTPEEAQLDLILSAKQS